MGAVIIEKFLSRAVEAYGNEVATVSDAVATGLSTFTDSRGIAAVADAYEGYFPQLETANKATFSSLATEGSYSSPSEFFQQAFPLEEVSKSLNDPKFNAGKELPSFLKNVFGKTGVQDALAQAGIIIDGGDEAGIIIHAFVQSLMKMKSTLENQQSMSQELSLPVFSNLRA